MGNRRDSGQVGVHFVKYRSWQVQRLLAWAQQNIEGGLNLLSKQIVHKTIEGKYMGMLGGLQ
jgi:hypothetical protein